jgi:hypothetical protein
MAVSPSFRVFFFFAVPDPLCPNQLGDILPRVRGAVPG